MHKLCFVSGSRAEYGLLRPVIEKFIHEKSVESKLIVTGSHLSAAYGNTVEEILKDSLVELITIPIPLEMDDKASMGITTGIALEKFSSLFLTYKPDLVVVLGDRFEIFAACVAAYLLSIPIAHISGGDVTEGAVDDALRNCITKMSYLHFPGCEQSRQRIIQMGEHPSRVFNVGELGVENCLKTSFMTRAELAKDLCFDYIKQDYSVVTFHPVTMEANTEEGQLYELIEALDCFDMGFVITMANADSGGRKINDIWKKERLKRNNWYLTTSLGTLRYLSVLKYAKAVIGNSSSGIFEAPVLKTPTVNIGDRQKGRSMPNSVVSCAPLKESIVEAISKVIDPQFCRIFESMDIPFGNGRTSDLIFKHIIDFFFKRNIEPKVFYEL